MSESFDIDKLFERAAAEVRPSAAAPCESLRCRAWMPMMYSLGPLRRCERAVEQHDGTCWEHRDYYNGWWARHVPDSEYMEDIFMSDNEEEMRFQIENGYVSLMDPELMETLAMESLRSLFFLWLCQFADFEATAFPAHISACVHRIVKHDILYFRKPYEEAFAALHRHFDRGLIFEHYIVHCLEWIAGNIQGCMGPANVLEGLLVSASISYRDIAGRRLQLAEHFQLLRNPYIKSTEDDDRYMSCRGRFWMWVSRLKQVARDSYESLRAEVLAAAWAPARMPFWCLDLEEVVEDYPEGLPDKAEFATLCASIKV